MKNILTLTITAAVFLFAACSDDDTNARTQHVKLLTEPTWSHAEVQHATDGDLSEQYKNFAISFTNSTGDGFDGSFIVANGGYAFPENTGKWKFNDDLDKIILNSGREIQFNVNENTLHLEFSIDAPGGRTNGLSGRFVFDLKPL